MIKRFIPILGFVFITAVFFWQFLFKGLLPIPADTIVGLYYPYRDIYVSTNPNGLPFKNFLITDPVRQQFPWRSQSIDSYKNLNLPMWNQYSFSGNPGLANFQSAVFYPLNLLFFLLPFDLSWVILIMTQPLLAGIFLYYYLRNLKLDEYSSFLGGVIFAFSGFFVTWLEWGTVLNTALWLPLVLLSIDKISGYLNSSRLKINQFLIWIGVFIFALTSSFFAGHLQTFFYLFIFTAFYIILRIHLSKNKLKLTGTFLISGFIFAIISLPQSLPTLRFINLSGRSTEVLWKNDGWFLPFQHLVQFIVPDFFGNPSTLNYWGVWNYGELTAYIGIVGLIFALFAIIFRRDKKTFLLSLSVLITLIIALPNPISRVPFILSIPFISTSQPTRILFITDFSFSILAAFGLNYFIFKGKLKQILIPLSIVGVGLGLVFLSLNLNFLNIEQVNLLVAKRNTFVPIFIFIATSVLIISYLFSAKKIKNYFIILIIALTILELFRFSWKFNSFSKKEYLYPETASIKFLIENVGDFRIATTDPRILAPNFSVIHKINSVEGYDPLYIDRYAKFIAAINRNEPNISPPFGFNRIVRIENFDSKFVDLLGVKYILSLNDLNVLGFEKVLIDGSTFLYENKDVLPRVFFVNNLIPAKDENEAIKIMYSASFDPKTDAVVEESVIEKPSMGKADIIYYSSNKIIVKTVNSGQGFLVLTDSFYPSWHVKINGVDQKIYRTDFNFRGVIVPSGTNEIIFDNKLL